MFLSHEEPFYQCQTETLLRAFIFLIQLHTLSLPFKGQFTCLFLVLWSPLFLSVPHTDTHGVNFLLSPVCLCGAAIMPLSTYLNYVSVSVSVWQWRVCLWVCVCALVCSCVLHLLNLGPLISSSGWTRSLSGTLLKKRPFCSNTRTHTLFLWGLFIDICCFSTELLFCFIFCTIYDYTKTPLVVKCCMMLFKSWCHKLMINVQL